MKHKYNLCIWGILSLFISLSLTACSFGQYTPDVDTNHRIDGTGYFDFSTLDGANFAVDYGTEYGPGALLEVYTVDPRTEGVTSQDAVFKTFLNEKGQYIGKLYLASWVSELWLKTPTLGPNSVVNIKIENSTAQYVCAATLLEDAPTITVPVTQSNYEVLAYEDMLGQADFDLNDVIVYHRRDISFGNTIHENRLFSVTDYFQNANCGAETDNAFAFQYATNYLKEGGAQIGISFSYTDDERGLENVNDSDVVWTSFTVPDSYVAKEVRDGDVEGVIRMTFILMDDCRQHVGRIYRVQREMSFTNFEKQLFEETVETMELLNPFIIGKYSQVVNNSYTEIHVTGGVKLLTERANNKNGWEDYFAETDGSKQYPYALRLVEEKSWDPVTPGVKIDEEYPEFQLWIYNRLNNPSDLTYNLWYRHKKTTK